MIIWTLIKDADLGNDSCLKGLKRADTLRSSVHKHQRATSKESYLILALILQPSTSPPLYRLCTFLVILSLSFSQSAIRGSRLSNLPLPWGLLQVMAASVASEQILSVLSFWISVEFNYRPNHRLFPFKVGSERVACLYRPSKCAYQSLTAN